MGHTQRYIFLILAVAWTLFRLLRYVRAAGSRRAGPAIPPSGSAVAQTPAPLPAQSPIGPSGGSRLPAALAALGILVAGNVVLWPLLFFTPGIEALPELPRLVAGVLANLILIRLAGSAAARVGGRPERRTGDARDPIR